MDLYNVGLDALADWETATYEWVLLGAGTFDPDTDTIGALVAAGEIASAGYARQPVDTPVRTVDDAADRVTYASGDVDFGTITAGETVTAVLLYRVVTDDSDAIPVGWQTVTPTNTGDLDPFVVRIADGTVAYIDQGA